MGSWVVSASQLCPLPYCRWLSHTMTLLNIWCGNKNLKIKFLHTEWMGRPPGRRNCDWNNCICSSLRISITVLPIILREFPHWESLLVSSPAFVSFPGVPGNSWIFTLSLSVLETEFMTSPILPLTLPHSFPNSESCKIGTKSYIWRKETPV